MTKFPRDEFDRVPQNSSRQGVHRVITPASRPALWPVLVLGALALVVGLTAFMFLPKSAPTASPSQEAASQQPTASPSASSAPSASPSATPTPSETPTSTDPVDKTTPVAVYNGAGVSGLASRVSTTVQNDGWALSDVGNWQGAPQQASAIFYNGPEQKGNAEALGKLLGITALLDTAEYQVPVVVVLGPGYN
ncbi:LytR C-terminal domain-containing protein [Arthrobacter celericrescens]|uniref:LytR C-terminal domain-containing protein n=1 Tax=Arthrobacter celericrescens TaxID=2320851 RepID=UPI000EA1D79C|nr:LytR C-terminal domain-containing protein [Arthrobacter celericrescens]